ncbi:Fic family protein [Nocardioides sp. NPDC059952]|uniref:Fic family protein n=1 Tax=Nocardioides sp. NPDC059952 TaxID=3347014 RepID=UPI0036657BC8
MSGWEEAYWEPSFGAPARSARRSGHYQRYVPDFVDGMMLAVNGDLSRKVAQAERALRALNDPGAGGLDGIARFLLRSEAIASSKIEGIAPSAQQVALAELGQMESVRGVSDQARLVANNMTVVRRSTTELVEAEELTVESIVDLHRSLLPDEPRHHGLRTVQNWIGGSDWNPIGAGYVPPAADRVPELMADLVAYLNGSAHSPLIQAAIVHAQFETVHPFTDGNGRVGRALIHTVLARRGLADRAVLPVSLVLATLKEQYVAGLTSFRFDAPRGSEEASLAINAWLEVFVDAAMVAVAEARELMERVEDLIRDWATRQTEHRMSRGLRAIPRSDSASARLLMTLPEAPVVTATTLARILEVSFNAASAALDELHQAGILQVKSIDRGASAYIARDVLDLVNLAERRLASTRFDTRESPPARPVPARQQADQ